MSKENTQYFAKKTQEAWNPCDAKVQDAIDTIKNNEDKLSKWVKTLFWLGVLSLLVSVFSWIFYGNWGLNTDVAGIDLAVLQDLPLWEDKNTPYPGM